MVGAEELSKQIKRYLVANSVEVRTDLNEAEVKELTQYLTEAKDKAGGQIDKFRAITGGRSYECFMNDLKNYKDFQFFNKNKVKI